MTFTLYPALDVANGALARTSTNSPNPFDLVRSWEAAGARWIHLVDLDAATGRGSNRELMSAIAAATDVQVQRSGGIVDDESLATAFTSGVDRVNLATAALRDRSWCEHVIAEHGDRVLVSLDVRRSATSSGPTDFRLVDRGSNADLGMLEPAIRELERMGCRRIVVADAARDGSLRGPDIALIRTAATLTSMPVIVSGGVSSLDDLIELRCGTDDTTVEGAVVGSALLAGRFSVQQAIAAVGGASERSSEG